MKYLIGGLGFRTQEAIAAHAKLMLRGVVPFDEAFVRGLFERHPDRREKCADDVPTVRLSVSPQRSPCFEVLGDDGWVDFSYKRCLGGRPLTHRAELMRAARRAVEQQILNYIAARPRPLRCEATGVVLMRGEYDVDHYAVPFVTLVDNWLASRALYETDVKVVDGPDNTTMFESFMMERSWYEYHRAHAMLRLVHRSVNQPPTGEARP